MRHDELRLLTIAHIDCDAFYASVEKRDRPELEDEAVIVGHPGPRGVVTTACYIARKSGVRSAMAMYHAMKLCPGAVVIPPDMRRYKAVSAEIRKLFNAATDTIEPVSLDEAYLDLSPACNLTGRAPAEALAAIARSVEDEVGVTVSVGLAPNKFLAKLASEMEKPRGFSVFGAKEARARLAPMPVAKINGVGSVTAAKLESDGIRAIGDLQALSEMRLVTQYGRLGRRLAAFAQGLDDREVTPDRETKSVSAETTLDVDTGDAHAIARIATRMSERVARDLARKGLAGRVVVLKLKTSDFKILTRSRRLPHPTQKAAVIADAAHRLVDSTVHDLTFRLVGVGVDDIAPAGEADPPDLFGDG